MGAEAAMRGDELDGYRRRDNELLTCTREASPASWHASGTWAGEHMASKLFCYFNLGRFNNEEQQSDADTATYACAQDRRDGPRRRSLARRRAPGLGLRRDVGERAGRRVHRSRERRRLEGRHLVVGRQGGMSLVGYDGGKIGAVGDLTVDEDGAQRFLVPLGFVTVSVTADPDTFPAGARLFVVAIPREQRASVDAAVESSRPAGASVALSYVFDITVRDASGVELQPAPGKQVKVSFCMDPVADRNLDTRVYHVTEEPNGGLEATELAVTTAGETASVMTDGFSLYTVEFTYGEKTFVLASDDSATLEFILEYVGLTGSVSAVEVSDSSLIGLEPMEGGFTRVYPKTAFTTQEWLRVTIDGVPYDISLTDTIVTGPSGSDNTTFAQDLTLATAIIDKSRLTAANCTITTTGSLRKGDKQVYYYGYMYQDNIFNAGGFTVTYKDAVILRDGSRKDLIISCPDVYIATRRLSTAGTFPYYDTAYVFDAESTHDAPSVFGHSDAQRHFGIRYDGLTVSIDGAAADDSFFYTLYDINVDRRTHNTFRDLRDADSSYQYAEAVKVTGGTLSHITTPPTTYYEIIGDTFVAKTNAGGKTYGTGFAVLANGSGLSATMWQSAPGSTSSTDFYLLPDKITHYIVSSSGAGGWIEVWDSGVIDSGTLLQQTTDDVQRYFDAPNGKDVTYKMTPKPGYIIDKLYLDGAEVQATAVKDAGGRILYYTYTVPGTMPDNTTIHVTWQPSVDVKVVKVWDDENDAAGLRPGSLDVERCKELVRMAGDKTKVFHRAIDVASDWKSMLGQLIEIGVDRVLTSGCAPDVFYGIDVVREMIEFAQGAIQILPGAGINLKNVDRIVEATGCDQVHVAQFTQYVDTSTANNRSIFYGGALYPPEDRYDVIDGSCIAAIRERLG